MPKIKTKYENNVQIASVWYKPYFIMLEKYQILFSKYFPSLDHSISMTFDLKKSDFEISYSE